MLKFLTIALATTSLGAMSAAPASACGGGCGGGSSSCSMAMAAPAATAQAPSGSRTTRSFSYEPSMPMRSYSAPMMRSRSSAPAYALPKGDSRKYGGF